jgi:hypothetical protein
VELPTMAGVRSMRSKNPKISIVGVSIMMDIRVRVGLGVE